MMIQLLKQNGAGYSSENGEVLMFNDTAKEILYAVSEHTESGAFSTFKISSYPGNYMNAGQCIFAIDSTAGATWMGPEAPNIDIADENLVDFEIEVMPIPQVNHEEPKMISQGPSICIFNKEDNGEVVASWLFAQYLLTNEVQIAYSTTEGYVPVTKNAQESAEYLDYLSREGEDNDEHYDVKIKASKILIENAENTFITPVFNGSASVRNAAGQMIEEVAKATERGKEVDDDYLKKLFSDVSSLYHLDGIGAVGSSDAAKELVPMPRESVILLSSIGAIWLILGVYMLVSQIKKRNKS
jgi:multiple sugar transport system substrate-binding protein